ncbi:hypothetical protein U9M48_018396 [Paspalum notatum var. saurae]|uniref:Mediator of RNA polymerase II transcription subunit 7 n=1 Tax=Paspalum notatum var. saurae TaxID=547442 RepID=A0AAQ3TCQ9_PASNO
MAAASTCAERDCRSEEGDKVEEREKMAWLPMETPSSSLAPTGDQGAKEKSMVIAKRQFWHKRSRFNYAALRTAMATSSAYPPPPPFYRLYKDYYEQDPSSAPEPPPPIDGEYMIYGLQHTTDEVLPSLEKDGIRQLYPEGPNIDFKKELRTLNRELQLHILELADILVERPSQYARRVEGIRIIFKNLHHLLNSLRPHQARATLIHMLESQIQRRKQAIEDIKQ